MPTKIIRQLFLGTAIYSWGSQCGRGRSKSDARLDAQMPNSLLSHRWNKPARKPGKGQQRSPVTHCRRSHGREWCLHPVHRTSDIRAEDFGHRQLEIRSARIWAARTGPAPRRPRSCTAIGAARSPLPVRSISRSGWTASSAYPGKPGFPGGRGRRGSAGARGSRGACRGRVTGSSRCTIRSTSPAGRARRCRGRPTGRTTGAAGPGLPAGR